MWAFAVEVGLFAFQHALHWHMIDFRLENLYVYDGGVGMLDFEHVVPRASKLSRLAGAFIQFLKDATHLLPEEYRQRWEKVHSAVRCVSQTNYCLEERYIQRYFADFTAFVVQVFDLPFGLQQQQTYPRPAGGMARMFRRADVEAFLRGCAVEEAMPREVAEGGPAPISPASTESRPSSGHEAAPPSPVPREAAEGGRSPIFPLSTESRPPGTSPSVHEAAPDFLSPVTPAEPDFLSPVTPVVHEAAPAAMVGAVAQEVGHDAAGGGDPTVGVPDRLPQGLSEEAFRELAPHLAWPWCDIYKLLAQHHPQYLEAWAGVVQNCGGDGSRLYVVLRAQSDGVGTSGALPPVPPPRSRVELIDFDQFLRWRGGPLSKKSHGDWYLVYRMCAGFPELGVFEQVAGR